MGGIGGGREGGRKGDGVRRKLLAERTYNAPITHL